MSRPVGFPSPALSGASYSAVELSTTGDRAFLLDQRALPAREAYLSFESAREVAEAIRSMVVRGAPAIGVAAAYAMALEARAFVTAAHDGYVVAMREAAAQLERARPTAVNLAWAVRGALAIVAKQSGRTGEERWAELCDFARRVHREDVEACRAMGRIGAQRLRDGATVLTHCNAGALATGGYGSALGVVRAAIEAGKRIRVIADETRPYLQGARLTAWELSRDGIAVEVITDSMAGHYLARGEISAIVVGADRIARNGDVANKIGTYGLACLAKVHDVPFYVAAPTSTIDLETPRGDAIVIEERSRDEVAIVGGASILPEGVVARHPAFDVTPARLVTAIFTERGAFLPGEVHAIFAVAPDRSRSPE